MEEYIFCFLIYIYIYILYVTYMQLKKYLSNDIIHR